MKKKLIFIICVHFNIFIFAQQQPVLDSLPFVKDTTKYTKSINYTTKRTFASNIKKRYADKDFIYVEELEKIKQNKPNLRFIKVFAVFMGKIFPFLLAGFVVFVILKLVLGADFNFWKLKKTKQTSIKKLVYEDEDIHKIDLNTLLKDAIANKNYRLAIRYHYLITLKFLSDNKLISYDKDKTNSAYKSEIKDFNLRNHYSYLSYVYTYVWYGEFPIDEDNFKSTVQKFESFYKTMQK